jgi:hypothetical protein
MKGVKLPVPKVRETLEQRLAKIKKDFATQEVNEKAYNKAHEKWRKEVEGIVPKLINEARDTRFVIRYDGMLNVEFNITKDKYDLPAEPTREFETLHQWQYKEAVEELEQAIRVLEMCEDTHVSASFTKSISKYL